MRRVALGSSLRRVLLGSLATSVIAAAAGPALAAGEKALRIPAGTLEEALGALSAQTGDQLLFPPELVAGRRAPALNGQYTTEQALRRLLGDEPIEARRTGSRVVVLKPRKTRASAPTPAPEDAGTRSPFAGEATLPAADPPVATAEPAPTRPVPVTLETVEVTGSHIRGAAVRASPLVVLDREALDRSGHATLAGALNALPQSFGGLNTEGTVATGADTQGSNSTYASGVNLRGLGSNATLVLVNGRRVGGSGFSGDFADVSTLPNIAVSRVDVLLDGASAIYGSDAVGGVVNIILRRDLEGGEARMSAGVGADGSPREFQVGAVLGHGWSSGNLLLAYEYHQRDPLAAAERSRTASADLRPFGGSDRRLTTAFPGNVVARDPATGLNVPFYGIPPGQNGVGLTPSSFQVGALNRTSRQDGQDVLPGQRRQSVYAAFRQNLGDLFEVSGDLRYGFRAARARTSASVATLTVGRANPFFVSPNGAASNQIQYSFAGELPNPIARATAETLTASIGGRLRLPADWSADGYLAFAQEIDEARNKGVVNTAILSEALGNVADRPQTAYSPLRDGYFNPYTGLAANPTSVTTALGSGFSNNRTRSQVRTANLQADGPILDLPGGDLKLALGVAARRETFLRGGMSYTSTVAPFPQARVSGERDVLSAFAEARAPIVGPANARAGLVDLELSGAVRVEDYSDFGRTVDPRVGLAWSPTTSLRLRATYGRSFRAPGLNQLLIQESISPIRLSLNGADVLTLSRQGGNPELEPETADTWTAGLDYRPSPRTRLSVTWFDTDFKKRISRPVNDNLDGALEDPRFADFVRRVSPTTNAADRALVEALLASPNATATAGLFPATDYVAIVDLRNVNTGELRVRGLDVQASHDLPAWGGRLTLSADATRLFDYAQRLTPAAPSIERLGLVGLPVKLKGRVSADWSRGWLSAGLSVNYADALRTPAGARVDEQTTVDLRLRLTPSDAALDGTSLSLSVRNLFNAAPPFYDNPTGYGFDPANGDIIGRFIRVELTRRW